MKPFIFATTLFILFACGNSKELSEKQDKRTAPWPLLNEKTFDLSEISKDKTYGYTEKNPIMVGGVKNNEGPLNERRYLNALAGPNGEYISYNRTGSCCQFKSENGFMGSGLLDMYEVTWKNQKEPVILYINMYDAGNLKAPVGFTIAKK